jgi:hypothetical protein
MLFVQACGDASQSKAVPPIYTSACVDVYLATLTPPACFVDFLDKVDRQQGLLE